MHFGAFKPHRLITMFTLGVALFHAVSSWAEPPRFVVNGDSGYGNIYTLSGKPYVSLYAIAKALHLTVINHGSWYELLPCGGANQIPGDHVGRMGEEVFTGQWRFQVTQIEYASRYRKQLTPYYRTETQAQPGDKLVIVHCRVKNGTKAKDSLVYEKWEGNNTALTDSEGRSYEPVLWDVRADQIAPEGAAFLPGAAVDFILVFNVPKQAQIKDLIFTAMRYSDRISYDQKKHPPTDIRYHLQ